MLSINDDWEFTALGVYNYRKPGKLDHLIEFIKGNHAKLEGDFIEAGVFRGTSLIGIAMLLKELGSNKRVYGFDSFSGFPPVYHNKDNFSQFEIMANEDCISKSHIASVRKNKFYRERLDPAFELSVNSLSTSKDFSETSLDFVKKKIDFIGIDNVVLVDGNFCETMTKDSAIPEKIFAGIVDCDLYRSYMDTYTFIWPRLVSGAVVYLDEYYSLKFPGAKIATDEFIQGKLARLEKAKPKQGEFERWHLVKE